MLPSNLHRPNAPNTLHIAIACCLGRQTICMRTLAHENRHLLGGRACRSSHVLNCIDSEGMFQINVTSPICKWSPSRCVSGSFSESSHDVASTSVSACIVPTNSTRWYPQAQDIHISNEAHNVLEELPNDKKIPKDSYKAGTPVGIPMRRTVLPLKPAPNRFGKPLLGVELLEMLLLHFQLARQGCVALLLKVLHPYTFPTRASIHRSALRLVRTKSAG